jgi:alpha-tubulin suppressor-like RCC1 family protein
MGGFGGQPITQRLGGTPGRIRSRWLVEVTGIKLAVAMIVTTTTFGVGLVSAPAAKATSATQVALGQEHTCAVTTSGGVRCWGGNDFGQLGDGRTVSRPLPGVVFGLTSGVAAITTGAFHSCALLSTGGVKCWGQNVSKQLGDGTGKERHKPVDVFGLTSGVTAITAGALHTCALLSTGGVKCWGHNSNGELGDATTQTRKTPVDVSGLTSGVTAITAGAVHTCALLSTGGLKCWGGNAFGQIGDNSSRKRKTPVDVSGLTSGVTQVSAGGFHACARTSGGGAKCWGWNQHGEVGDGTVVDRHVPTDVSGLTTGVTQVSAGQEHSCARMSGGSLSCWGDNARGQMGDGTTTSSSLPVGVSGLGSGVVGVVGGFEHTCARMGTGGLKCWGANDSGQLGDGSTSDASTAVDVVGITGGGADTQAPTVTVVITGPNGGTPDGNNGWFVTGPIKALVTADDTARGGSPITAMSCGADQLKSMMGIGTSTASGELTIFGDGVHAISCTGTDAEGNTSAPVSKQAKADKNGPTLTVGAPDVLFLHESAQTNPTSNDNTSGLAGPPVCDAIDTSSVGVRSVSCSVSDLAGNTTVRSASYTVRYRVVLSKPNGSYAAGTSVPVEFALFDDSVTAIPRAEGRAISNTCRAKVTFSGGGSEICAIYDDVPRIFNASIPTASGLAPGAYQVVVRIFDPTNVLVNTITKSINIT